MTVNSLCLHKNYLHLHGFPLISDVATFCIYPGGITIMPKKRPREETYYIEVAVDDERNIYNDALLCCLNDRGMSANEQFVQVNGTYVECYPCAEKKVMGK